MRTTPLASLATDSPMTSSAPAAGATAEPALVGRTGRAVTPLRPSGVASIDGRRYPVVSEGDHVVAGEAIEVVTVEGNRIVVRRPTAP